MSFINCASKVFHMCSVCNICSALQYSRLWVSCIFIQIKALKIINIKHIYIYIYFEWNKCGLSTFVNTDPDIQTLKRVFSPALVMRPQLLPCLLVIPLKVLSVTGLQLFMNHSQSPLKMWVMLNIALCRTPSANNNIALPFLSRLPVVQMYTSTVIYTTALNEFSILMSDGGVNILSNELHVIVGKTPRRGLFLYKGRVYHVLFPT